MFPCSRGWGLAPVPSSYIIGSLLLDCRGRFILPQHPAAPVYLKVTIKMALTTNRRHSVDSVRNHDVEFQDEKQGGDVIAQASRHHMNIGLSEEDILFLENFPDEKRRKTLRKVRYISAYMRRYWRFASLYMVIGDEWLTSAVID